MRHIIKQCAQLVEKVCDIKYYGKKMYFYYTIQFSNVTFPSTFEFLIIFGIGFELPTVVRIRNVVFVRTLYGLVHAWL